MASGKFLWRPRFSLRTLLIATALVASVAAWFTHTTMRQRRAVAELTKLGADVVYEDNSNPRLKSWYPHWLRNWLGIDFFAKAAVVTFGDSNSVSRSNLGTRSTNVHSGGSITQGHQVTRSVPSTVIGEDAMQQVRRLPHLRKLTIKAFTAKQASYPVYRNVKANIELDVPSLQLLRDHPTLKELELPSTYADDEVLAGLHGFQNIERLRLGPPQFSEAGGKHLQSLPNLEELSFAGLSTWEKDCDAIPDAPVALHLLGALGLYKPKPWPVHECFPRLSNLRVLHIPGKVLSNEIARCFEERLPRLETIECHSIYVDDEGIRFVGSLLGLRKLDPGYSRITDKGAAHLAKLTELRELRLTNYPITDEGLRHLSKLTKLETLSLWNLPITDAGLEHLRGATAMRELTLYKTRITGAGLVHLSGMTKLESLNLGYSPITDAGLEHLRGATGIRDLTLCGTRITDAGMVHLSEMTGLHYLGLSGTTITDESIDQLLRFKNLKGVDVGESGVSLGGFERLKAVFPSSRHW